MMTHTIPILSLLLAAGSVLADGKLYARERVPPDVPYQRALILYQEQMQTDLTFSRAQDNTAYREHIIQW